MNSRLYNILLLFSLFGIAMWFFGNLYEAVVIGPNMLGNSDVKMRAFRDFFTSTNPAFFYIPVSQLAVLISIFLYLKTPKDKHILKRTLLRAVIVLVIAMIITIYLVTQINIKLFFGDEILSLQQMTNLAVTWNILNIVRILLAAVALGYIFKAWSRFQKEKI
jgi:hypothetical protein